jgi:DNA-binding IclR family transcriptional regulator
MADSTHVAETVNSGGAQTLARGLSILKFLVAQAEPQRPSQIASGLQLERSAVYRLLRELESSSFVTREPDSGRYIVGTGLIALSALVIQRVDLRRTAQPFMEQLSRATNETISLHLRQGSNRVCVDVIPSRQMASHLVEIGETVPLYAGPSGNAILAFLEPTEAAAIVEDGRRTRKERDALLTLLEDIRQRGYVASVGDRSPVVAGLSAPVFSFEGVRGSLTVTGPSSRWDEAAMESAAPLIVKLSRELSASLGHRLDQF